MRAVYWVVRRRSPADPHSLASIDVVDTGQIRRLSLLKRGQECTKCWVRFSTVTESGWFDDVRKQDRPRNALYDYGFSV